VLDFLAFEHEPIPVVLALCMSYRLNTLATFSFSFLSFTWIFNYIFHCDHLFLSHCLLNYGSPSVEVLISEESVPVLE
jgi:hypothetical protein